MSNPEQVIGDWLDGSYGSEALPRLLPLTPFDAERMRRAAEGAALQAYRRVLAARRLRMRLHGFAIGESTEALTAEVLRGWLDGRVSGLAAADLIGTTPYRLEDLARQHGLIP